MIIIASKQEKELLENLRRFKTFTTGEAESVPVITAEVVKLKRQLADLEIQRDKKQEDFDKRERELRHMIGLEKKRQEFEIQKTTGEVSLKVREEALKAEQKRFTEQLAFNTERFSAAEKNLKDILAEIIKRLPNVNMEVTRKTR